MSKFDEQEGIEIARYGRGGRFKTLFVLVSLVLLVALTLAGCQGADLKAGAGAGQGEGEGNKVDPKTLYEGTPLAGKEGKIQIAVIRNLGADEHTAQFLAGAKGEGEALGFKVDTFTTDGDNAKFEDIFSQVLAGTYQGIVVSHGQDNAKALIEEAAARGIKVVTFDTAGEVAGVPRTAQDDFSLARQSLEALVAANPGKTPKIIKMWVDGFPPMERRETVYQEFLKAGKIQEVAVVGEVGDFSNVAGLNADAIGALLTQHKVGEIDAIWASWDAFATGAHTALVEQNRTEVKIFGIDVSNADLQLIQAENSPWVTTAAADAKLVGVINLRLLAKQLAGETVPETYEIPATVIHQKDLSGTTTLETLQEVYTTWGASETFDEAWIKAIKEKSAGTGPNSGSGK